MGRTVILNVVGLTTGLIGEQTPVLSRLAETTRQVRIRPVLPAVTCTAQATYLTGRSPSGHGIVANGWFDRTLCEHHFWKQSNRLVKGEKLWETLGKTNPGYTCAKLFWWFNMWSTADWGITPRPIYCVDGRKVFDVHANPLNLRDDVKRDLGEFPFHAFWGPKAGLASSRWIADSAKWIEKKHEPDLNLVYLPHLDYNLQRLGPSDPAIGRDLLEIDGIVGDLLSFFRERGIQVLVLSEYGITDVSRVIYPNRVFRERGWLQVKDELGLEMLDCGASRAFAITDHQVTHVYVNDESIRDKVREVLEGMEGVSSVHDRSSLSQIGLDHERSGDFVAFSDEDAWFAYYHWLDDAKAPDFARCVDVHRKYGYDPVELFLDPSQPFIKGKIGLKLLKKKLGMRMLMDVIPLDAGLVRGSHGTLPANCSNWPVLIGDFPEQGENCINATEVQPILLEACRN